MTAAGYRQLAELSRTASARAHMLAMANRWENRARKFEQEELRFASPGRAQAPEPNPCRKLHGPGPAGKRCAGCALLHTTGSGNRPFYKCALRIYTRSQRSGHRMRWLACAKFEPRE